MMTLTNERYEELVNGIAHYQVIRNIIMNDLDTDVVSIEELKEIIIMLEERDKRRKKDER